MAKKDKNKENKVSTDESTGSKIVTVLIVLVIVVIWLAIFGVLIKLDVGNFGSEVLYPVVNMILPEPAQNQSDTSTSKEYDNLTEANARIKELESQLAANKNAGSANQSEVSDLQAEINRLKKFEQEFDKNVVYNDKAPDTEEFKKYYEEIEPDNAEKIYKEVCKDYEYTQEIKDQADAYGKMEPASAAAILSEMTNDLTLVAKILDSMQTSKSALILQNMKPTTAAQVTTKMTAMKNK